MRVDFKYKTGQRARDRVSGLTGIIDGIAIWLNGCVQYSIQAPMKKGATEKPSGYWIDEAQIVIIGEGINVEKKETGGPSSISHP